MKRNLLLVLIFVAVAIFNFSFPKGLHEKSIDSDQVTLALLATDANADSEGLICRCHSDAMCWAGSWLSFRIKCAEFPGGTGDCHAYDLNCY